MMPNAYPNFYTKNIIRCFEFKSNSYLAACVCMRRGGML